MWARRRARSRLQLMLFSNPPRPLFGSFSSRRSSSACTSASARSPLSLARSISGRQGSESLPCRRPRRNQRHAGSRLRLAARVPTLPREPARLLDVSAREPRAGLRRRRLHPVGHEQLRYPRGRNRAEAHLSATRGNRRQQSPRRRADQHQMRERRGLLERLQQRVLRLVVHALGVRDHEHAAGGLERPQGDLAHDLAADIVHQDLVGAARLHPGEVGMYARADATLHVGGVRLPATEQGGGERARRGALAGAGRPVEEVRV